MSLSNQIQLIECPRDAMQGWKHFIPTEKKAEYINSLLQVGFDTIDFGSFVSARTIPQMSDTRDVLTLLDVRNSRSKLLSIVANPRGASQAAAHDAVSYLGFPFSVSETFQQRNTNSSINDSLLRVEEIQNICIKNGKELVVYISMAFGNPYGDEYAEDLVYKWVDKLATMGIKVISLADTIGVATPEQVGSMTGYLVNLLPSVSIGVHLHSTPRNWKAKLEAALDAGCRRFDGTLKGIGGCPMAKDELVGNMNTEWMIAHLEKSQLMPVLDKEALQRSIKLANEIFQL